MKRFCTLLFAFFAISFVVIGGVLVSASFEWSSNQESSWVAHTFHYVLPLVSYASAGYTPDQIRTAYNLPEGGGSGTTIAIIEAYKAPTIQSDLAAFSNRFGLPAPTSDNFEIHPMSSNLGTDTGWSQETALDVEWAHAIAPDAKILLVQARSPNMPDLLPAVDYARGRPDVVAISMSWGDDETFSLTSSDYHFTSNYGATFFASSGDSGSGAMWPASSPYVVGVGGTTLNLNSDGTVISETAWSGSGGGPSTFEAKPSYQANYGLSGNRRIVPDVSYNANPSTGVLVYINSVWYVMGGTSAGAPQWAAIQAFGRSATNNNFYARAKSPSNTTYFRDITSGSNGAYNAGPGYDYVTGLGTPITTNFATPSSTVPNSVTLIQAGNSTPLSTNNKFTVSYILNGAQVFAYAQNGTTVLKTDANSNITVSASSTSSTDQEKWVLNSNINPVSGTNLTLYYYDILAQTTNYTIAGGGTPQTPTVSYSTAPANSSDQTTTQTINVQLTQAPFTIWPVAGTNVFVTDLLSENSAEQWSTPTANWLIKSSNQIPPQITYFHQYNLSVGYQISGGDTPTTPILYANSYGATMSFSISRSNISIWLDAGTQFQLSNNLSASNSNERWSATNSMGTVSGPLSFFAIYYHQFNISPFYSIAGDGNPQPPFFNFSSFGNAINQQLSTNAQSFWADYNTQYTITTQLDGSAAPERWFNPSNSGIIQNSNALNFTYYHQFLLNSTGTSISPQWYNDGSLAQIIVPGVIGRISGNGTGERLSSYSIDNGIPVQVQPTAGFITIPIVMNTTHLLTTNSIPQYQINTSSGSLNSISQTPINGDNGWYDNGTTLTLNYDNSWNSTSSQQRLNAVSYSLNSGSPITISRSGTGTFSVQLILTNPVSVEVFSIPQYLLTVSGGNNIIFSRSSPTKDSFYDSGSIISVTTDRSWGVINGNTRQILNGYAVNGVSSPVNETDFGSYSLQISALNSPELLTFNSTTQYLISFQFKDNSGTETIIPTYFQIRTNNSDLVDASQLRVWLDSGTQFQIQSVIWQSIEVKPDNLTTYFAIAPLSNNILCDVFTGKILIQNNQGSPLPGVQMAVTLANQTTIQVITDNEGTTVLPLVPQGTFTAKATYMGENKTISGDFSKQAAATGTFQQFQSPSPVPTHPDQSAPSPSIPELSTTIAFASLIISSLAVALFLRKKRKDSVISKI